jgi:hypothetical protein
MATDKVQRRLAAVLAADVVGYSQPMVVDEEVTMACQSNFAPSSN